MLVHIKSWSSFLVHRCSFSFATPYAASLNYCSSASAFFLLTYWSWELTWEDGEWNLLVRSVRLIHDSTIPRPPFSIKKKKENFDTDDKELSRMLTSLIWLSWLNDVTGVETDAYRWSVDLQHRVRSVLIENRLRILSYSALLICICICICILAMNNIAWNAFE